MYSQHKVLVPLWIERPCLVAGVEPGQGVAGEVEGAEGVAAAGHVLADQVAGLHNLQVGLEVRLLKQYYFSAATVSKNKGSFGKLRPCFNFETQSRHFVWLCNFETRAYF